MERRAERPQIDLNATLLDARARIDKKLGVPAHETATQVERVAKALYKLGAVEPRLVIHYDSVVQQPIITFGTVAEGFVGSIGPEGIMRFGPKEVTEAGIALNLDKSHQIHEIPGIDERQIWRTTLEWGERAMTALTGLAETFMSNQTSQTQGNETEPEHDRLTDIAHQAESCSCKNYE
jgi:hypothetical protein